MQILKRLLALLVVFFGWKSLQAQPLPASPPQTTPAPATQSGVGSANPSTTKVVTTPAPGTPLSLEQEQKARALLKQATGAAIAADSQAKPATPESKVLATPAATALDRKVKEDTARDQEIARIEAAVEEARKRRETKGQTLAPPAGTPTQAPSQAPAVAVTPTPAAPVSPLVPAPAAPAAPVAPEVTTARVAAPVQPADQAPLPQQIVGGLSADQQSKAQNLLKGIVEPTPLPVLQNAAATAVLAPKPEPRDAVEQTAAPKPAPSTVAPSTPEDEQQRKILSLLRAQVVIFDSGNPNAQSQPVRNPEAPNTKLPPGGVPATPEQIQPITPLPAPIEPRGGQPNASVASAPVVQMAQASPSSRPAAPATPPTLTSDKETQARELLDRISKETANKPDTAAKSAAPATAPAAAPAPIVIPAPSTGAAPPAAGPATHGSLTTDKEMQARELLDRVSKDIAAKPPQAPDAAITTAAPAVVIPSPSVATTPAPAATMSAEKELKARNLLNQAAGRSTSPAPITPTLPLPAAVPPETAVVPTLPPPASPVLVAPAVTPGAGKINPDKEARARELLDELRGQKAAEIKTPLPQPIVATPPSVTPPPVTIVPPPPVTPAPVPLPSVTIAPPPPVVVTTPPATISPSTQPPAAIINPASSGPAMTPEQEAKARELLSGTAGRAPTATVPPGISTVAPTTTVTPTVTTKSDLESYKEARKRAEQDAKLRKKAEDKARKETDWMQAETRARAKEDLRRKAEAEARAKKETEATVASIRTKEREDFRKRSDTETKAAAESIAVTPKETIAPPPENSVAVARTVPAPAEVKSAPPAREPKKSSSATNARPEEDPAFPAAKRQQLMKLLNDYRQDKITPEEYHSGRAKIIAAP